MPKIANKLMTFHYMQCKFLELQSDLDLQTVTMILIVLPNVSAIIFLGEYHRTLHWETRPDCCCTVGLSLPWRLSNMGLLRYSDMLEV